MFLQSNLYYEECLVGGHQNKMLAVNPLTKLKDGRCGLYDFSPNSCLHNLLHTFSF